MSFGFRACTLGILIAPALAPWQARADDFTDFQEARTAYERQEYDTAVVQFEALLEEFAAQGDPGAPLVLETRKYLASSLVFLGRNTEASRQFELLLQADAEFPLDPAGFPDEVVRLFFAVRERLKRQHADAIARREQESERRRLAEEAQQARRRALWVTMQEMAAVETVERQNSRWLALLPFGVGQFRNDHRRLGAFLASFQSLTLSASFVTQWAHAHLAAQDLSEAEIVRRADRVRAANIALNVAFCASLIAGIIDAQIRFRPVIRSQRPRALPESLSEDFLPAENTVIEEWPIHGQP
ncbi:MAG: hypothetical protein AAF355_14910 [Myxococcota bacterium]